LIKNHQRVGAFDVGGEFAQGLRHQPGLQAHVRIAHFAFDFSFRRQGSHGVDHDHIDRAGAYQHVGDFERLFAGIGLGNQQVGHVHAQFGRVLRVERVFRVDKRSDTTQLLHLGDDLKRQGGFTGRFRTIDFDDTAARQTTDAQGQVKPQRTSGNSLNIGGDFVIAHPHDGTLAELLLDLRESRCQCLAFILIHAADS